MKGVIELIVFHAFIKIQIPVWGDQSKSAALVILLRSGVLSLTGFCTHRVLASKLIRASLCSDDTVEFKIPPDNKPGWCPLQTFRDWSHLFKLLITVIVLVSALSIIVGVK